MKIFLRKAIALILAVIMVLFAFVGCRSEEDKETQKSESEVDTEKNEEKESEEDIACIHSNMQAISAKLPTCTQTGNISYWCCAACGKYFIDAVGSQMISAEQVVLPARGHTEVVDEAIIPTDTSEGLTEGSHCSVCNEIIKEQIVTPVALKEEYTIQYMCDMVSVEGDTYKPSEFKVLKKPQMDNYQFLGWSDKDGHFFGLELPKGMSGDLILYANWASNRNKAEPVSKIGAPIICEDSSSGQILFIYEIGKIKNIPLFETRDLLVSNGIITITENIKQNTITNSNANEIGKIIANTTTNSSTWTFSKDWNEIMSVSEEWAEQQGMTVEQANQFCQSSSNTYNVINSSGGSSSLVNSNNSSYRLSANQAHSESTYSNEEKYAGLTVDEKASTTTTVSAGINAGISVPMGPAKAELGASMNTTNTTAYEISANYQQNKYTQDIKTGTDSWEQNVDISKSNSQTSTATKTWNTSQGFSASSSTSASETISKAVSELISKKNSQDSSYTTGGAEGEEQAFASSNAAEDKYSSSVVYSEQATEISKITIQSTGNTYGAYRLVQVGTARVFAVVGYDIESSAYYTYTYSVLDDEGYKEYLDYSYDRSFSDYETSTLPFEIPIFVNDYVNSRITSSKLQISDDGVVTKYLGTDEDIVLIPSYYTRKNSTTGKVEVIKVTGITEGLFKNNTAIKGVSLGNFVNEIPASAFEGCTSLKEVICPNVVRIGENAFKGCTLLSEFMLPNELEYLGKGAFDGVTAIKANAFTIDIANAVANSNAKNITLDISNINTTDFSTMAFDVGYIESFKLIGGYKVYNGLSIKSNAENTIISGVEFENSESIPLEISSPNLTLERVSARGEGFVLVLKAEKTVLSIENISKFISQNGRAVLAKSIELKSLNEEAHSGIVTEGSKVLVCGSVTGNLGYIDDEVIESINESEYNSYLTAKKITFNPNGGAVSESERTITYGGIYGALPIPTREGYTFVGWYTDAVGGSLVEAHHTMNASNDHALYARWIVNTYELSWNEASHVSITVRRTASPYANATIGDLNVGDTIYYGDALSVIYTAEEGYSVADHGLEAFTVSNSITATEIYATASANSYMYEVVYKSSNGTVLGSTTVSYTYGTTNTVSPATFAGYITPEAQNIVWDSVTPKTITFVYAPKTVGTQSLKSGWWWKESTYGIKYSVTAKVTNRTADSVTVEITWINSIVNAHYTAAQYFTMTVGGKSTGEVEIASASKWAKSNGEVQNGSASKTVTITVTGISATDTELSYSASTRVSVSSWDHPATFTGSIAIPTY